MDEERTVRFEAIYGAAFSHILGYALRRCDCAEDAADVVAETFAIAWRRIDAVPPGDQARLWLYGVARNVLANHRRGVARRADLSAALAAEITDLYQRDPVDAAERDPVGRAFRSLPAEDRELLSLVAWEGLDHGEIAELLGCSRNAIRIRLHRARKRLTRELASTGEAGSHLATTRRNP